MTIPLLFALHALEYGWGFVLAVRSGRRGIPLGFALGVLGMYTLFTPWLLWYRGEDSIAGLNYGPHLAEAMGVYMVGVGIFLASWAAFPDFKARSFWKIEVGRNEAGRILVLLAGFLAVFLYGLHQAGVPLGEWLQWKNSNTYLNLFGKPWPSPLVDKAADGMITLGYLLLVAWPLLGLPVGAALLGVFALAGFRYRLVLLTGSGLLYAFGQVRGRGGRIMLALGILVACLGMAWITLNRIRVSQRLFKQVDNDLTHFDLRLLANETNNSQTFRVLLGYYHAHGSRADGLLATPTFVAVRALPVRVFPEGKKPVAPLLQHIRAAYDATPEGAQLHPAVSNLEEYYLGYGMAGVVVGMGLLALLCRWMGSWGPAGMPLGTLFLFQLISRGYLPQQVDLAVFLLLPVGLLWVWQRLADRRSST